MATINFFGGEKENDVRNSNGNGNQSPEVKKSFLVSELKDGEKELKKDLRECNRLIAVVSQDHDITVKRIAELTATISSVDTEIKIPQNQLIQENKLQSENNEKANISGKGELSEKIESTKLQELNVCQQELKECEENLRLLREKKGKIEHNLKIVEGMLSASPVEQPILSRTNQAQFSPSPT